MWSYLHQNICWNPSRECLAITFFGFAAGKAAGKAGYAEERASSEAQGREAGHLLWAGDSSDGSAVAGGEHDWQQRLPIELKQAAL